MVDLGRTWLEKVAVTGVAPEFQPKIVFVIVSLTRECKFLLFFSIIFGANSGATRVTAATSPKVHPGSTISALIYQISPAHLP